MSTVERAQAWMKDDPDPETRAELEKLLASAKDNATELDDRFARALEFGTAGLRGVIGAGPNRMNRAVVRRTSWGVGKALLSIYEKPIVVIGFDGRRQSDVFAEDAARVLAALGIQVHLFEEIGPTPLTAFAVKELHAHAGVMVTASHNPPEYNGYKVYWASGAQIVPPIDTDIASRIDGAPAAKDIALADLAECLKNGLIVKIGSQMAEGYLRGVAELGRAGGDRSLQIVYTALHGAGDALAMAALARAGFTKVASVAEQQKPDGRFPTVAFPNPEEKGAMDLSFAYAKRLSADLVLANDPDADRLAVAVPDASSPTGYWQLTGNDVGVLLGHYVLTRDGASKDKRIALASIVSSPMLGVIAQKLGVRYEETLTGFKWIEHRAMEVEKESGERLVFGYEEALGYTIGTLVRDKDGISAAVVFAELAAKLRAEKKTVRDRLDDLFREYGLYVSGQVNVVRKGVNGPTEIADLMTRLRNAPPTELAGLEVVGRVDYAARERVNSEGGRTRVALPASNVLVYELAGGSRVIARPSGTEPKVKYYFDVREEVREGEPLDQAHARAKEKLRAITDAFTKIAGT